MPWATPAAGQNGNLPEPRAHAASFTANGALYMIGGTDAQGAPQKTNYWAVPNATTGDIASWSHNDSTDLPDARARRRLSSVGSTAFVIGGQDATGPVDGSFRAGLSPKPPFFRLGLFGATIPALSIKGEIGQQLGYIDAMTVGLINFGILVIIGLAFSHRAPDHAPDRAPSAAAASAPRARTTSRADPGRPGGSSRMTVTSIPDSRAAPVEAGFRSPLEIPVEIDTPAL